MKKSLISIFLVVAMMVTTMFSMVAVNASADDTITYTIETVETEGMVKGDTFTVDVSISAVDVIGVVEFKLAYDSSLFKATAGEVKGFMNGFLMKGAEINPASPKNEVAGTKEVWVTGFGAADASSAGEVIATITFEVIADVVDTDSAMVAIDKANMIAGTTAMVQHPTAAVDGGVDVKGDNAGTTPAPVTTTKATTTKPTTTTTEATPDEPAEKTVVYTLSTYETAGLKKGDTFTVELSTSAIDEIAVVEYRFAYDAALFKAVKGEVNGYLADFLMKDCNIAPAESMFKVPGWAEVWVTGFAAANVAGAADEVIATVTFEVIADEGVAENSEMVKFGQIIAGTTDMVEYKTSCVDGGVKVIAGPGSDDDTTTTTTVAGGTTTAATTTTSAKATTTTTKTKAPATGDASNAVFFVVIAVMAAVVVTASVVATKKAASR